jgi:hypothetical protein
MNQAAIRALYDLFVFIACGDDELLDQDACCQALESMTDSLLQGSDDERAEICAVFRRLIASDPRAAQLPDLRESVDALVVHLSASE